MKKKKQKNIEFNDQHHSIQKKNEKLYRIKFIREY